MIPKPNNSALLLLSIGAIAAPLAATSAPKNQKKNAKPNIIYIMADDHTSQAIGAYNSHLSNLNPTPNIDALAQEGIVFDNVFCNNSISTPSRASIMTGQYSHNNGVLTLEDELNPQQQHLAREMKELGYQTAIVGKWHLHCEPSEFDYYSVFVQSQEQGYYFNPQLAESDNTQQKFPENTVQYEGHSTDIITDITIDWLDEKRDSEKPFFVMHHFKAPHGYFEYHSRYADYLEDVDIPVPETLFNREGFGSIATRGEKNSLDHFIGTSVSNRNVHYNYADYFGFDLGSDEKNTIAAHNKYMKDYLRCVKGIDDNLARLFQYLKDEGLWENTIIIYTADQGMMLGEHDLQDKRWMYEESLRMPYIMRVPGGKYEAGSHNELMIQNVDFAPTILSLAGAEKTPAYMQGEDFSEVFSGGDIEADWRDAIYYRYWMHMSNHNVPAHIGIRTKDYKLIFFYGRHYNPDRYGDKTLGRFSNTSLVVPTVPAFELYDMRNDPLETTNIAEDPAYAEVLEKLKGELLALKVKLGDLDITTPEIKRLMDSYLK
ncbi:MAG: sulfatase [Rikenellaceae bacterium]